MRRAISQIAAPVATGSLTETKVAASALKDNLLALIADIQKHKPSTSKGVFLQHVSMSSTMGPGIGVDRASLGS